MAANIYSFGDALRLTGAERGHLARWAEQGVIHPDLGGGGVSGAHRKFSFRNLFEIALAVELQKGRVSADIIRWMLIRLRMLDPDTASEVPANRARRELMMLTPKEQRAEIARLNKDLRKRGGFRDSFGNRYRFNPDAVIDGLAEALASDEDNDAKRWNRFKAAPRPLTSPGFVTVALGVVPIVNFETSLRELEAQMSDDAERPKNLKGNVTIVINAGRILRGLEVATGDHL
jgi:hypothetical protein